MPPPGHFYVGTVELSISFLFSTRGRNSCILCYQIAAHCQLQSTKVSRTGTQHSSTQIGKILIFDEGEGFDLYPFSEIVGGDQQ